MKKSHVETCFNYCSKQAFFSSDEMKWINRIRKLAAERPEECIIIKQPEDNDGCIYAKVPSSWLKVQPKKQLSDRQLKSMMENLNLAKK